MKPLLNVFLAGALGLLTGCGGRAVSGDGTVRDEEELTPAVDLIAVENADLNRPQDEMPALGISQRLLAIAASATARAAVLDDPALVRAAPLHGTRATSPSRSAGEETAGGGAPADRAWELKFPRGNTIEIYAHILDFFGIELGVLQPDGTLIYASGLAKPKPDLHTGPASQEHRCYLTWSRGNLADADRQFLARAGVDSRDKVVLKLLRPELEALLAGMEKDHAGGKVDLLEKTRFGIRRKSDGYDIFVLEQTYKSG